MEVATNKYASRGHAELVSAPHMPGELQAGRLSRGVLKQVQHDVIYLLHFNQSTFLYQPSQPVLLHQPESFKQRKSNQPG